MCEMATMNPWHQHLISFIPLCFNVSNMLLKFAMTAFHTYITQTWWRCMAQLYGTGGQQNSILLKFSNAPFCLNNKRSMPTNVVTNVYEPLYDIWLASCLNCTHLDNTSIEYLEVIHCVYRLFWQKILTSWYISGLTRPFVRAINAPRD